MSFGSGSRLDGYELLSPLGTGGMGEVWLATDVRLARRVAVKLLPAGLTRDTQRVSRFEQEARAASALNHPNVCTILALGQVADGQHYLAMEYVDGETLRTRLGTSRLTIRQSLDIAIQIAAALVAAHSAGIVHRDIKPENVMLRPDGLVKVLDFGLAKFTAPSELGAAEPTRTVFRTDAGSVVGTVAYMSPEQARGEPVDARTDLWSLGCVLSEMVTGRSTFGTSSNGETVAAILHREPPPLARYEPGVPAELQRIVSKALRKDRTQRYQTAQDLLLDLQALRDEVQAQRRSGSSPAMPIDGPGRGSTASVQRRRRLLAGAAVLVLAIGAVGAVWWATQSAAPSTGSTSVQRNLTRLTFGPGLQTDVTFSPDGRFIAYASDRAGNFDVWVQPTAGGEPVQVTKGEAHDTQPDWSPDGSTIVFRSERAGSGLFAVPALGGVERQLTSFGSHPSWSPDGREILFLDGTAPGDGTWALRVYALSVEDNSAREVLGDFLAAGSWFWAAPHPDGRISAMGHHWELGSGFFTVSRDGAQVVASKPLPDVPFASFVGAERRRFAWGSSGTVLYLQAVSGGVHNLWKVAVDPATSAWASVERLTTGAGPDLTPTLSRDGSRLAFSTVTESSRLWAFPLGDGTRQLVDGKPVTEDGARADLARLSPDGRYVAYNLLRSGAERQELWVSDLVEGTHRQLPTDANVGCWSPSQDSIVTRYTRPHQGTASGAVAIRQLTGQERFVSRWTPAYFFVPADCIGDDAILGTWFSLTGGSSALAIWSTRDPDADRPQRLLVERKNAIIWQARLSPNRRWMSFVVDSGTGPGALELAVAPADAPEPWSRIAADHAWPDKPRWAADGRSVYFISRRGGAYFNLWAVRFDPYAGTPVGEPFVLTSFDSPSLHISPQVQVAEMDISAEHAVLTMRTVSGSIWMLDNVDR